MNDEHWVDGRLQSLDPSPEWQPQVKRALISVRNRTRRQAASGVFRRPVQRWMLAAAGVCGTIAIVMLLPSSGHCAGITCSQPVIEIYSDYQCPPCAQFNSEAYPRIVEKYVRTGKVKLVHRDLPLPPHPYAKLAARYANAARQVGYYDIAVDRIFSTQALWSTNGDIGRQLATVLPPEAMRKVRQLVEGSRDDFTADARMAANDGVEMTPAMIVVLNGNRQMIAPIPSFTVLERYLDEVLGH